MHKLVLAAAVLLLCGCTMGPDFKSPSWASPGTWFSPPAKPVASTPVAEPIDPNWWGLFHDNELTSLEDHVATENLDVQVATIRLAELRAQLGITAADAYPNLEGNASYERQKSSNNGAFASLGAVAAGSEANGAFGQSTGGVKRYELRRHRHLSVTVSTRHGSSTCGAKCGARSRRPMPA